MGVIQVGAGDVRYFLEEMGFTFTREGSGSAILTEIVPSL